MIGKAQRREAAREFKERKPSPGIYAIECSTTGQRWIDASLNLDAAENGQFFQLRQCLHRNKEMQATWNAEGETAFRFAIVERLPEETSALNRNDLLVERKRFWAAQSKA
ncbi:MAG TPA: GIY-YIG nuclease family protein [Edaphobacter sp.]|jgi:hypothetical protein|nr:GIY-YIG nuclease family protein [Edaphobacter sp.]